MWFLKLHWFWKFLIISGAVQIGYALVTRGNYRRNPLRWGSSRALRW